MKEQSNLQTRVESCSKEDKSYVEGATDHYENFKHNKVYLDNYGKEQSNREPLQEEA